MVIPIAMAVLMEENDHRSEFRTGRVVICYWEFCRFSSISSQLMTRLCVSYLSLQ